MLPFGAGCSKVFILNIRRRIYNIMERDAYSEDDLRQEALGVFKGLIDHIGAAAVRAHLAAHDEVEAEGLSGGIAIPDEESKCYVLIGPELVKFRVGEWSGYSLSFEEALVALEEVEAEKPAA